MKRVLICLLLLVFGLQFPLTVSAASQQTVFIQNIKESVVAGESFTCEVALKGNKGLITGAVKVEWPKEDLKLTKVAFGSIMPDNGSAPLSAENKGVHTVTFGSDTATKNYVTDGVLFTLTFEALESASGGEKTIALSYAHNEDDFLNFDLDAVPVLFENGKITIEANAQGQPGATPTDPADPTDPTTPADPANPSDPEGPTDPSNPADPADPLNPADPTNPSDPSNPDPGQQPGTGDPQDTPEDTFFEDVKETDYFYKPVKWAVENGITSGVSKTLFGPSQNCTRGQVVTFLWIVNGKQASEKTSPFTDVPADAYFAKAVSWAVEQGITAGLSEKEFGPSKTVTRAQFVTMLWVAKGMPSATAASNFADVPANAYYAKAVAWAFANDITAGKSATSFAPDDPCTRGQIVTFLYNAYK